MGESTAVWESGQASRRPVVAVVGAGAVGGYYGARLAQHGSEVHLLLRRDYAFVRNAGLRVRSCDGDFALPAAALRVYERAEDMPRADLVLVALKTTANAELHRLIRPLVGERTAILTIQNGLGNEDRLIELFGPARVLGGVAFVCINREGPGVIHHIAQGLIRLGEFGSRAGAASPRADAIARLFRDSAIRCEAVGDVLRVRWEKLIWNVPFNGLGAALDLTTDRLIDSEPGRALIERLMREVIAAARADGVELPSADRPIERIIEHQFNQTRLMGAYQTSMQIDRREGRPLEVEAILGEPARRAAAAGLDTPLLEMLDQQVRLVDPAVQKQ